MIQLKDYRVHENKLYVRSDNEWVSGWNAIEVPKNPPTCQFKGGKMSLHLWFQILAFFKWTQDKYKSESQVRLYYNKESKTWGAHPYPQSPSGMTTNDSQDEEIRAKFPDPWVYFGTAHHHCTTKAFQSGTDEANERQQDGWHYTIGCLDSEIYDFHGRFSWAGELFQADLFSWIDLPDWAKDIPSQVRYDSAYDYVLHSDISSKEEYYFPEEWKDSIKPKQTFTKTNSGFGYHQTYLGGGYGNHYYEPVEKEIKKEKEEKELDPSQCVMIESILFDAGLSLEEALDAYEYNDKNSNDRGLDSNAVELEFLYQNLELSLRERGISPADFRSALDLLIEEEVV